MLHVFTPHADIDSNLQTIMPSQFQNYGHGSSQEPHSQESQDSSGLPEDRPYTASSPPLVRASVDPFTSPFISSQRSTPTPRAPTSFNVEQPQKLFDMKTNNGQSWIIFDRKYLKEWTLWTRHVTDEKDKGWLNFAWKGFRTSDAYDTFHHAADLATGAPTALCRACLQPFAHPCLPPGQGSSTGSLKRHYDKRCGTKKGAQPTSIMNMVSSSFPFPKQYRFSVSVICNARGSTLTLTLPFS